MSACAVWIVAAVLAQTPPTAGALEHAPMPHKVEAENPDAAAPITLHDAINLALVANLDIAQSRAVLSQAQAALLRARVIALPNFNLTSTYVDHEGNIQRTEGNIVKANRDSLFVGDLLSVQVSLSDAIFTPMVARQLELAREAGLRRATNDSLLAVIEAYTNLLRARRRLARVAATLEALTSAQASPTRGNSKGLLPLVRDVVEVGGKDALKSDLYRVEVEVFRRQEEQAALVQEYRVTSAELSRLLQLDARVPLCPLEDFRHPLAVSASWEQREVEELVAFALMNRPEMAETQAEVQAAVKRVKAAKLRPLLPNFAVNYGWGGFGGGPDPNPQILQPPSRRGDAPRLVNQPGFGPSGEILHMNTRSDFEATLFWRLQNLGFGNLAEVREQRAVEQQAVIRRMQAQNRVAAQVVASNEQVVQGRERVRITQTALFDDKGELKGPVFESLRLNFERVRGAEGRPLETLDSVRGLNDLLDAYANAASDYDRARYRLLWSLGLPPQEFLNATQPGAKPPPH